ncbi:MAG: hypothetical protein KME46_04120 [Brasilonema angustatum HA4187-MV1]|jgi:hypothetical protein|nr:hypothetical protein [Brasilonema angustatum HA4187-MV1]
MESQELSVLVSWLAIRERVKPEAYRHLLTCAHVVAEALGIPRNTQELPTGTIELCSITRS